MKALRVLAIMMILMAFSILQPLAFNDLNVSTAETQVSGESILTQEMIDEFMQELNDFRAEEGLQPVGYNAGIQAGADIRAGESAIEFGHTRPNGEGFSTAFENPNEPIRMENIAGGYATVSAVFQGWKDSEGHRANMLIPDLQSVVLGVNNPEEEASMSPSWALIGSGYAGIPDNDEESEEEESESEETEEGTETEETEEGTETEETEEGTETEETEEGTETEETEEGTETEETEEGTETEETEEGTETEEDDAAEEEADQANAEAAAQEAEDQANAEAAAQEAEDQANAEAAAQEAEDQADAEAAAQEAEDQANAEAAAQEAEDQAEAEAI